MTTVTIFSFFSSKTREYDLTDAFIKKHKICNGMLTRQQSDAIAAIDKPWIVPELVRNPLYMHLH